MRLRLLTILLFVGLLLISHRTRAERFIAFSLGAAKTRIESNKDWRTSDLHVLNLAGINQVEGFVYDAKNGDLILVGHQDDARAKLTLDDLVVAMRARLRYGEWPLVSIDPTADSEQTGKQHVRWEGHVEDTAFGLSMYLADYRMKQIAMGLERAGINGVRSVWDQWLAEPAVFVGNNRVGGTERNCRFWFYPVLADVKVIERAGICVTRGFRVAVFSELMSKVVDGKLVTDLKGERDSASQNFADNMTNHFDELCAVQPEINRLRGLEELVGVSYALEHLEPKPELDWWLNQYPLATVETPRQSDLLRREGGTGNSKIIVSGGVHLTALATRLRNKDVPALREAVLSDAVRPKGRPLSWSFLVAQWVIPLDVGTLSAADVAELLAQSRFLHDQGRLADEVSVLDNVLKMIPDFAEVLVNKGQALEGLGKLDEAMTCYDRASVLDPKLLKAWVDKGHALFKHNRWEEALDSFDHAVALNGGIPQLWLLRGLALYELRRFTDARSSFTKAAALGSDQARKLLVILASEGH